MLIAICDDELIFCEQLKKEIYNYSSSRNLNIVVEIFLKGNDLIKSNKNYDLIFLDYNMPEINGLETAQLLRQNNRSYKIVFLTSYTEIVYESFKYDTFRFLTKPVNKEKLYETLDSYRKKIDLYYPISINVDGDNRKINTKDILYIEADGRNCVIRLLNESFYCNKTLSKILSLLPSDSFFKTHRSYIVNFLYIDKYDKKSIYFTNGEIAKISRDTFSDFKSALNQFLNNNVI